MQSNRKTAKPPLRVADFICLECRVQATCSDDRVCGICKALGKSIEPRRAPRQAENFAAALSAPVIYWLTKHRIVETRK